jgi:hypothetical protein
MRVLGFKRLPLAPVLALLTFLPLGLEAQLREVISNEVAVSEDEAMLRLGFEDSQDLIISFHEGQVLVDGEVIGGYARQGPLFVAWRSLLGEVLTLEDGPLARRLNDWDPPENLDGEAEETATFLDETLEAVLASHDASPDASPDASQEVPSEGEIAVTLGGEGGLLGTLLTHQGALSGLAQALEGVSLDQFILKIGEDVQVGPGEEMEGNLILVDGDLDIQGRIVGDVVVTGGTVRLREDGEVVGNLRIADGTLNLDGESVSGELLFMDAGGRVRVLSDESAPSDQDLEDLRTEIRSEQRRESRASADRERRHSPNVFVSVFGNIGSAIAGILEDFITFLILAVLGVLAFHFQRERLEVVSTMARRAPMRSAVVGFAGGFFLVPIWILGMIALAITVIGIPVLLAWIPLFPIAAAVAILLGYLGVARNVGEWVAEQEYKGLEWIRGSNTFYTLVAGVGALMVPSLAEKASRILGFGFLTDVLGFVASMVTLVAVAVGLGAVLLTRGGKIRPMESYHDFEEDYWADMEPTPTENAPDPEAEVSSDEGDEGKDEGKSDG